MIKKVQKIDKSDNQPYRHTIFLLRTMYPVLIGLIDALCGPGRYITVRNTSLNYYYTVIKQSIEELLKTDGFEDLAKDNPELFESLIGDVEEADIEWEFLSKKAYEFLGKIENLYILSGSDIFELPTPIKDKLTEAEKAIKEHKKMCAETWESYGTKIKDIKENINWDNTVSQKDEQKTEKQNNSVSKNFKTEASLLIEKGVGYFKFYKQGPRIEIGNIKTRKFRLLNALIEPFGIARTIETVFEAIKLPKDRTDSRLADNYLSQERRIELIEYTMKELQKIKGLTGKIKLGYTNNQRSVWLILKP